MDNDVYIAVFDSAGNIVSVTIIDEEYADHTANQLRTGGRKIRRTKDRSEYLNWIEKDHTNKKESIRLMEESLR